MKGEKQPYAVASVKIPCEIIKVESPEYLGRVNLLLFFFL